MTRMGKKVSVVSTHYSVIRLQGMSQTKNTNVRIIGCLLHTEYLQTKAQHEYRCVCLIAPRFCF
jgi:hypothetical protein